MRSQEQRVLCVINPQALRSTVVQQVGAGIYCVCKDIPNNCIFLYLFLYLVTHSVFAFSAYTFKYYKLGKIWQFNNIKKLNCLLLVHLLRD